MKKSQKKGAHGKRVPTAKEVDALCDLPDAEFERQLHEAYPEDCPPADETADAAMDECFAKGNELRERRAQNGGILGDSYAHDMTPEEEAEANRLVDEAIEADRQAAQGRS